MKSLLSSTVARVAAVIVVVLLAFAGMQQLTLNSVRKDLRTSQETVGKLTVSLSVAVKTNADNAVEYRTAREQQAFAMRIAEDERRAAAVRATSLERELSRIHSTPQSERAPVSPVVRDTVNRLWPEKNP